PESTKRLPFPRGQHVRPRIERVVLQRYQDRTGVPDLSVSHGARRDEGMVHRPKVIPELPQTADDLRRGRAECGDLRWMQLEQQMPDASFTEKAFRTPESEHLRALNVHLQESDLAHSTPIEQVVERLGLYLEGYATLRRCD